MIWKTISSLILSSCPIVPRRIIDAFRDMSWRASTIEMLTTMMELLFTPRKLLIAVLKESPNADELKELALLGTNDDDDELSDRARKIVFSTARSVHKRVPKGSAKGHSLGFAETSIVVCGLDEQNEQTFRAKRGRRASTRF